MRVGHHNPARRTADHHAFLHRRHEGGADDGQHLSGKAEQQHLGGIHPGFAADGFRLHLHHVPVQHIGKQLNAVHRQVIRCAAAQGGVQIAGGGILRRNKAQIHVSYDGGADAALLHPLARLTHRGQKAAPQRLHGEHPPRLGQGEHLRRVGGVHEHGLLAQDGNIMVHAQAGQGGVGVRRGGDIHAVRQMGLQHLLVGIKGLRNVLFLGEALRPFHGLAGHGRYAAAVHQADRVAERSGNRPCAHDGETKWSHGSSSFAMDRARCQKGQATEKVLPSSRGSAPPVSSVRDAAQSISRRAWWRRLKARSP